MKSDNNQKPKKRRGLFSGPKNRRPFSLYENQTMTPDRAMLFKLRPGPINFTSLRTDYKKILHPIASELIQIRKSLRMSQQDFALALGINKDALINFENGRSKRFPEGILDEARNILKEEESDRVLPLEELSKLSMTEIMSRWRSLLQVETDEDLSILLGASRITLYRWRRRGGRPDDNDLLRYDRIAHSLAKKMRRGERRARYIVANNLKDESSPEKDQASAQKGGLVESQD